MFIFPTLLSDFKNPIQNWHREPALWCELHIAHAPLYSFTLIVNTKIYEFAYLKLIEYFVQFVQSQSFLLVQLVDAHRLTVKQEQTESHHLEIYQKNLGMLRDKTMDDKLFNVPKIMI